MLSVPVSNKHKKNKITQTKMQYLAHSNNKRSLHNEHGQGIEVQGQGLVNWSSRTRTFLEDNNTDDCSLV